MKTQNVLFGGNVHSYRTAKKQMQKISAPKEGRTAKGVAIIALIFFLLGVGLFAFGILSTLSNIGPSVGGVFLALLGFILIVISLILGVKALIILMKGI